MSNAMLTMKQLQTILAIPKPSLSIFVGNSTIKPEQRYSEHGLRHSLYTSQSNALWAMPHGAWAMPQIKQRYKKIIHANDKTAPCNRKQANATDNMCSIRALPKQCYCHEPCHKKIWAMRRITSMGNATANVKNVIAWVPPSSFSFCICNKLHNRPLALWSGGTHVSMVRIGHVWCLPCTATT